MSNFSRRLLMVAAVAGAALTLASCNQGGGAGAAASTDAMTMGDPNAPVHVEEYASTTCSHCGRFALEVFPAFKAKYIDTGKVKYTLHEFLTPPEAVAAAGFLTARCARGTLLKVAQSAGMTEEQFNKCVQDEKAASALNARVEKAIKDANISSTPTFIFNGKKVKEGEMTMEELDAAVAAASKK